MSCVRWSKPGAGGGEHHDAVTESGGCYWVRPQQQGKILYIIRESFISSFILSSLWLKFPVGTQLPSAGIILIPSGQSLGALEAAARYFSQLWGVQVQGQVMARAPFQVADGGFSLRPHTVEAMEGARSLASLYGHSCHP